MYYAMRASAPSLHRESTDSLIIYRHDQKHILYMNIAKCLTGVGTKLLLLACSQHQLLQLLTL